MGLFGWLSGADKYGAAQSALIAKYMFSKMSPDEKKDIHVKAIDVLICEKVDRCLQFFGIKVLNQFFLGGEASDAFVGPHSIIEINEPSQLVLSVG